MQVVDRLEGGPAVNASEALGRLRGLGVLAASTSVAPAILGPSIEAAL